MPEARRVHLHDDERDAVVRRLHAALRVAVGLGGVVVPARQPAQKLRELALAQLALVGTGAEQSKLRESELDRKSTRLNSSHSQISYAVFCLKKKNQAIGRLRTV